MGETIGDFFNQIGIQILSYTLICVVSYAVTLIVLRVFRVPYKIANFIAGIAFLYSAYYIFTRVVPNI